LSVVLMTLFRGLCLICLLLSQNQSIVNAIQPQEEHDDDSDSFKSSQRRTFRSGQVAVHVVPNFLPYDLAVQWRDTMTREWDARYQCQTDTTEATACTVDNDNGWRYGLTMPKYEVWIIFRLAMRQLTARNKPRNSHMPSGN
jgi:hypothetical protein